MPQSRSLDIGSLDVEVYLAITAAIGAAFSIREVLDLHLNLWLLSSPRFPVLHGSFVWVHLPKDLFYCRAALSLGADSLIGTLKDQFIALCTA